MPIKILKSILNSNPQIEVAAAAHAKELRDWRDRELRVVEDKKNNVPESEAYVSCVRPMANSLIEDMIDEDFNVNFEMVDDTPSEAEVLASKKTLLLHHIKMAEVAAEAALVPQGKRRMLDLRSKSIVEDDNARLTELIEKSQRSFVGRVAEKIGVLDKTDNADLLDQVIKSRSDEDARHMDFYEEVKASKEKIISLAAQAESDVEDLTIENVDAYTIPSFDV
jgi:hypothetical protein